MDIGTLSSGLTLLRGAVETVRQVITMLPDSSEKADATAALEQAERELKTAEAKTAHELKYELCRAHFPPEIMLSKDDAIWNCPVCNNRKDKRPKVTSFI